MTKVVKNPLALFCGENDIQNVDSYQDLVNANHQKNPQHDFQKAKTFLAIEPYQGDWSRDQGENS